MLDNKTRLYFSTTTGPLICTYFFNLNFRYTKLAELKNDKMHLSNGESRDGDSLPEDMVINALFSFGDNYN